MERRSRGRRAGLPRRGRRQGARSRPPLPGVRAELDAAAAAGRRRRAAGRGGRGRRAAACPARGRPVRRLRPQPGAGGVRQGTRRQRGGRVRARARRRLRGRRSPPSMWPLPLGLEEQRLAVPPPARTTGNACARSGARAPAASRSLSRATARSRWSPCPTSAPSCARRCGRSSPPSRRGAAVLGLRAGRPARRRSRARRGGAARGRPARPACRVPDRSAGPRLLARLADCVCAAGRRAVRAARGRRPVRRRAAPRRRRGRRDRAVAGRGPAGRRGGRARPVDRRASRAAAAAWSGGSPTSRRGAAPRSTTKTRCPARSRRARRRLAARARACRRRRRALVGACGRPPGARRWGAWAEFFAGAVAAVFDAGGRRRGARCRRRACRRSPCSTRRSTSPRRRPCCASCWRARASRTAASGATASPCSRRWSCAASASTRSCSPGSPRAASPPAAGPTRCSATPSAGASASALGVRLPLAEQRDAESLAAVRVRLRGGARAARAARAALAAPPTGGRACRPACCCGWRRWRPAGRSGSTSSSTASRSRPVWRRLAGAAGVLRRRGLGGRAASATPPLLLALSAPGSRARGRGATSPRCSATRRRRGAGSAPGARRAARCRAPGTACSAPTPAPRSRPRTPSTPRCTPRASSATSAARSPSCCATCSGCDAPDEPGDALEMDAREFGTLAHDILQRAYEQVIAGDLRRDGALAAVRAAWETCCAEAERRGVTGAALSWEVRRELLLEDLLETVRRDPVFARPGEPPDGRGVALRRGRGPAGRRSTLPGGRSVRFAGRLDRVDADAVRRPRHRLQVGRRRHRAQPHQGRAQRPAARLPARACARPAGEELRDHRLPVPAGHAPRRLRGPATCRRREEASARRLRELVARRGRRSSTPACSRASTRQRCDYCDVGYACGVSAGRRARKREHELLDPVVRLQSPARRGGRGCGPERRVCDQDVRDRVTTDLGTTFLLEAGAGTGKTRVLVDRYVSCVLDPVLGTGDVRTVAAITFTEKAAGELRQRVREEFERLADGGRRRRRARGRHPGRARRSRRRAHQHHPRLRRPPAARVPGRGRRGPGVRAARRARVGPRARPAVGGVAHGAGRRRPAPSGATRRGCRACCAPACGSTWLRDARRRPQGRLRRALRPRSRRRRRPPSRTSPAALDGLAAAARPAGRASAPSPAATRGDKGCSPPWTLVEAGRRCWRGRPETSTSSRRRSSRCPSRPRPRRPAAQGQLGPGARRQGRAAGRATARRSREVLAALARPTPPSSPALAVAVADAFSRWAGATQLALGPPRLHRPARLPAGPARRATSSRAGRRCRRASATCWSTSSRTPTRCRRRSSSSSASASPWRATGATWSSQPGKLFVVGDPKQSIYRFRRADIGMYDQVKAPGRGAAGRAPARSRPSARTSAPRRRWWQWVNNVFADVFDEDAGEGRQPGYQWVEPFRPAGRGAACRRAARRRPTARPRGAAEAARQAEARALAALLAGHARRASRSAGRCRIATPGARRRTARRGAPPRWGDVALLFRATTGLETYEQAFREAGVPYRVDGGKAYFARREVDDALLCLRAVDDPSDGPAVYGALHSTFFGFSDDELFLFWAAGGRFDLFAAQPEAHAAVGRGARDAARAARASRRERAARAGRRARAAAPAPSSSSAATGPGGAQAIANLEKLVDRARAFSGAGGRRPRRVPRLGRRGRRRRRRAGVAGGRRRRRRPPAHHPQGQGARVPHRRSSSAARWAAAAGAASPSSTARSGGWRSSSRPSCPARRRATSSRSATRRSGSARSSWRRARAAGCCTSPPRALATAWSSRCFGQPDATRTGPPRPCCWVPSPTRCRRRRRIDRGVRGRRPAGAAAARARRPATSGDERAGRARPRRRPRARWRGRRDGAARARRARRRRPPARAGSSTSTKRSAPAGPGAPAGRARALALGSAVHRIMELCDLGDEASVAALPRPSPPSSSGRTWRTRPPSWPRACWRAAPVRAPPRRAGAGAVYRELPDRRARRRRRRQRRRSTSLYRDGDAVGRRRLQDRPRRRAGGAPRALPAAGRRLRAGRRGGHRRRACARSCFVAAAGGRARRARARRRRAARAGEGRGGRGGRRRPRRPPRRARPADAQSSERSLSRDGVRG